MIQGLAARHAGQQVHVRVGPRSAVDREVVRVEEVAQVRPNLQRHRRVVERPCHGLTAEADHGVEDVVYLQTVGSNDLRVAAFTREMRIPENNFVMVSHAIHRF